MVAEKPDVTSMIPGYSGTGSPKDMCCRCFAKIHAAAASVILPHPASLTSTDVQILFALTCQQANTTETFQEHDIKE